LCSPIDNARYFCIAYLCTMFIKKITKGNKEDKQYTYYRLCQSVRIGTKTRHHNLLNLGSLESLDPNQQKLLANRIEALYEGTTALFEDVPQEVESLANAFYRQLRDKHKSAKTTASTSNTGSTPITTNELPTAVKDMEQIDLNSIQHDDAREVGAEWLCLQTILKLKIPQLLATQGWDEPTVNSAIAHIVSRAVYPASEHKTAQWMDSSSAITELIFNKHQPISYQRLYRLSLGLYEQKEALENHLSVITNELFGLQDKIILYDLTNTYFEGRKAKSDLAQFGRSKEKRSDAKLISLALVINSEGFVKHSKIYEGNIAEPSTLLAIVETLKRTDKSDALNPIIVMDAGIATSENLKMLKEKNYDYLCVTRSKLKEYNLADNTKSPLQLKDNRGNLIEMRQVEKVGETDKFLHIRSAQKAVKEASMAAHFSVRFEQELNHLSQGLSKKGSTKKLEKVWERIGRIKERYPSANKHYTIDVGASNNMATKVSFARKEAAVKSTDGVYFLRTSLKEINEQTFWNIYNTLTEVEATFRILKTDLSIRPVYHQKDGSSTAHIHLGIMAYMVVNTIRYQLKQKNIHHDWTNIIRIMNTQKLITSSFKNNKEQVIIIKKCSQPVKQVHEIYEALNYKKMPFAIKKYVLPQK